MVKKKKEEIELITVIPKGNLLFWADSWENLLSNGNIGSATLNITPDQKMIDNMQTNITNALEKIEEYKLELLKAQELLTNLVPHESYEKLEKEFNEKKQAELKNSSPKLK